MRRTAFHIALWQRKRQTKLQTMAVGTKTRLTTKNRPIQTGSLLVRVRKVTYVRGVTNPTATHTCLKAIFISKARRARELVPQTSGRVVRPCRGSHSIASDRCTSDRPDANNTGDCPARPMREKPLLRRRVKLGGLGQSSRLWSRGASHTHPDHAPHWGGS